MCVVLWLKAVAICFETSKNPCIKILKSESEKKYLWKVHLNVCMYVCMCVRAMGCGQNSFKTVWRCHQLLFGILAKDKWSVCMFSIIDTWLNQLDLYFWILFSTDYILRCTKFLNFFSDLMNHILLSIYTHRRPGYNFGKRWKFCCHSQVYSSWRYHC